MRPHWTAFLIGLAVGAGAGYLMGNKAKGGNVLGITGKFAKPFGQMSGGV